MLTELRVRAKSLKNGLLEFVTGLSWRDLDAIEERLALRQVQSSGWFLLAPIVLVAAGVATMFLFPAQTGTDSAGLTYGTLSIVYMALALLLATRLKALEWAFGGFDRLHVWHRWTGIASVVFLFFHTSSENEVGRGTLPFGDAAEEAGMAFASPAQTLLVTLIVISMLRVLPYRIWRFSHLIIFLPFALSVWHAVTAERPQELFDLSGAWLWLWAIVGLVSFLHRILAVDSGFFDRKLTVTDVDATEGKIEIKLSDSALSKRGLGKPGQFIFLRVGGFWREAHPFSIAKDGDSAGSISILMSKTGDWTDSQASALQKGDHVLSSKPHGHLDLRGLSESVIWVAGGSGVTPFLQSESYLGGFAKPPTLTYFYRGEAAALGLSQLRNMNELGFLGLNEIDTSAGSERNLSLLASSITAGSHLVVCGPRKLVIDVLRLARKSKAASVVFEIYDYRSPFGPDLNALLKHLLRFPLPTKWFAKLNWLWEKPKKKSRVTSLK